MVYKIPEFESLTNDERVIAYLRLGRLLKASLELQGPGANRRFIGMSNNQAIKLLQNVWGSKMTAPSLGKYVKGTAITGDLKADTFQQLGSLCFKPSSWKVSASDPVGRPLFPAIKQYDEETMITAIYSPRFDKLPDSQYRMSYEDVINFMLHPPLVKVAGEYQDQFASTQLILV